MKDGIKLILIGAIIAGGMTLDYHWQQEEAEYVQHPVATREEAVLTQVFADNGSPEPAAMAKAVMQTKRPDLMAAIAIRESNGNPKAIGDGGRSRGAFQIQPQHWGPVPVDPTAQALQAERILEELVQSSRGRLRSGLARYNGGDKPPQASYRYATWVIKKSRYIKI